MKKLLSIFVSSLLLISISGCTNKEEEILPPEKVSRWIEKEISNENIFSAQKDDVKITISKIGSIIAGTSATVSAQVSGKIEDIKVKQNDVVEKNDILAVLGDSLSTDISEIQYESAVSGLNIVNSSLHYAEKAAKEAIQNAELSVELSYEAYQNAIDSKKNALELYYLQVDDLEETIEDLEDTYDDAKDDYYDAKDALDNAYDSADQAAIEAAILAKETAKAIKDGAKEALESAEDSLEQMETTNDAQVDQLNFAITSAKTQYEMALNQLDSAKIGYEQQILSIQSQQNQAQAGVDQAELSIDYTKVRSPITGVITSIYMDEGNITSPGQPMLVVENTDSFTVKTSINETERPYIKEGNKVIIETPNGIVEGNIDTISEALNPQTKKIDVEIIVPHTSKLKSGDLITVYFTLKTGNKIFIPINSIFLDSDRTYVKIINSKDFIEYRTVETGDSIEEYIEITDGLEKNEEILKITTTEINEGDKIILID
ncbi:efflux RND transporter periplasmic adaptor subunit [Candidatus Peregrinibacteria bacterium]|nr:efflux RND transporter periplasmic adaptor subunit [Candidatus Peregrinibacteria bacterium]